MIWKTSLLVISKILRLFGNTFRADHIYSLQRLEKFLQQFQKLLTQKRKRFSLDFIAFLESPQNFGHSEKKDQLDSINIFEFIDTEECSYINARKFLF